MCSPSAPDTSRADANAARITQLSEEQFNWVRQQYEAEAPQRDAAASRAAAVSDAQLAAMRSEASLADESANDYRTIYRPLEQRAATEAANYDTEARREEAAGKAVAGVTQAFGAARDSSERNLESMGVNPNDGAFASGDAQLQAAQALGSAGAANRARDQVAAEGRAMRNDVIATGRGLVSSQGTQVALSNQSGNSSSANAQVPLSVAQGGVQMVSGASGQAVNGLAAAGNIYERSAALNAESAQASSNGTNQLAGAAMTAAALF